MFNTYAIYMALALLLLARNYRCSCLNPELVNLSRDGTFCSATSSMLGMPCQHAWDEDSGTIWHPGTSGEMAHTAIYMQDMLVIKMITVKQYSWVSGYASKMELEVNGKIFALEDIPGSGSSHSVLGWKSDKPEQEDLPTKLITLRITEVGPRPGSAFGGIQRIKIFGCFVGQMKKVGQTNKVKTARRPSVEKDDEEDVFLFDTIHQPSDALLQAKGAAKEGVANLSIPLLVGGVVLLTMGLCVWMVVYGVRARKQYFVTEGPRVRISPSSNIMESQDRLDMPEDEEDIHTIPYP